MQSSPAPSSDSGHEPAAAAGQHRRSRFSYGPSFIVALAAATILFAGPRAMRGMEHARREADVRQAVRELEAGTILEELNAATRQIAVAVEPSVVHVSTAGELRTRDRSRSRPFTASGSGWIYDEDGHIVTNAHVIEGAQRLEVQMADGSIRNAEIVGVDLRTDIAVVRVPPGELIPARRSRELPSQGDLVFAFGSPFDFRFSMSSGIVSGVGRAAGLQDVDFENFIQVDAAINPGNSGGPLTDVQGRVIGMNTAIATGRGNMIGQGQFAGIGLAIPMAMIENFVDQMIDTGEVEKGFIGISMRSPDEVARLIPAQTLLGRVARTFRGDGVVVVSVVDGGPADMADIRLGDVIEAIDGTRVSTIDQVRGLIGVQRPGDTITITIWRLGDDGQPINLEIDVELGRLDPELTARQAASSLRNAGLLGLETATDDRAQIAGVPFTRGVLVMSVDPRSQLADFVPSGSTLVNVDGQFVPSVDQLYARLQRKLVNAAQLRRTTAPEAELEFVLPDGTERVVRIPLIP